MRGDDNRNDAGLTQTEIEIHLSMRGDDNIDEGTQTP
jgi:hypothetical protein